MSYLPELLAADQASTGYLEPLTIGPWKPALGAVVRGLRYEPGRLSPQVQAQLRNALLEYGALIFEPGTVDPQTFTDLIGEFGPISLYAGPKTPTASDSQGANIVDSSNKRQARNFLWHIDQAFRTAPPSLTALYGHVVPEFGGDTLFSNAVMAWERLDTNFVAYLETLTAVHYWDATGHIADRFDDLDEAGRQRAVNAPIETPLFRVHPQTGRKQLFVNESYTTYIKNVSRTTSQHLLGILFEALKEPEVEARLTWERGASILWDNRVVQHRGVGDFRNQNRVFYRACVA
jgi:taurine dioxygenase